MAITTTGFDGTVNEAQWAELMRNVAEVAYKHGVPTGFDVTPGGGTREVSITSGTAVLPGLLTKSDATATATFAANTGSTNRIDYLVLRANWSTNAVTVAVVQGSGANTAPALVQNEGVTWEMPLARVTVRPSVSTLLTTDIVTAKPLPRTVTRRFVGTFSGLPITRAYNSAPFTVSSVNVTDPGWPYRLIIRGAARYDGGSSASFSGAGGLRVTLGGVADGPAGITPQLGIGSNQNAILSHSTAVLNGPVTVDLQMYPAAMPAGYSLTLTASPVNVFEVDQFPA